MLQQRFMRIYADCSYWRETKYTNEAVFGFKEAGLKLDVTIWSRGLRIQSDTFALFFVTHHFGSGAWASLVLIVWLMRSFYELYTLPHIKPECRTDCRGAHKKIVLEGFPGVINQTISINI